MVDVDIKIRFGFRLLVSANNIKILESYRLTDRQAQRVFITCLYEEYSWMHARSRQSYIRELRAHNRLYRLHLFRSHTQDCDLNADEPVWRRIAYTLLGW